MNKSNIRTGIIDISSFQSGPEMSLTTLSAQVVSISGEKLWQVVKLICLLTFELISQNAHFFQNVHLFLAWCLSNQLIFSVVVHI